ncbi:hypothetical protein OESDEN_02700, partial [Oesophagostomum dentatum]
LSIQYNRQLDVCFSGQNSQLGKVEATVNSVSSFDTRLQASNIPQEEISTIPSRLLPKRDLCRNPTGSLPIKKARTFDALPSKSKTLSDEADKDLKAENINHPNMVYLTIEVFSFCNEID